MWSPFVFNDTLYVINMKQANQVNVLILLTDFESLWSTTLTNSELIAQFEDHNPLVAEVGTSSETIINKFTHLMSSSEINADIKLNINSSHVVLEFHFNVDGVVVQFCFNLVETDKKAFVDELVLPLIRTINYLEHRQEHLMSKIAKRDKLILDYKMQMGELSDATSTASSSERRPPDDAGPLLLDIFHKSEDFCATISKKFQTNLISPTVKETCIPAKKKQKMNKAIPLNQVFNKK